MYKHIIILLFLLTTTILLTADEKGSVILSGATISDACYGLICHGPTPTAFDVYDDNGDLILRDSSCSPEKGYYSISGLMPGRKYKFVVNDSKYLKREYIIDIPSGIEYAELSKDFLVVPAAVGVAVLFDVSPFFLHKSKIRDGISYYLDEISALIVQNPNVKYEIACYPDDDNDAGYNMTLTLNRGVALMEYFISKGALPSQLEISPSAATDAKLPPYDFKMPKGKRYIGSTYLVIKEIEN